MVWKGVTTRPLYNLPAVLGAKHIVFAEGEKDCDRLTQLLRKSGMKEWAASTNFDGAEGPWREEYKTAFAGKEAIVLPDNDDAGRKHAEVVARGAASVARCVRILTLPELPEKGDVSDYLDAHTAKDFFHQLQKAHPWKDPALGLFLTAAEFAARTPEEVPWLVEGLLGVGVSTSLQAAPKAGKSTFTHYMIRSVLDGRPFLGRKTTKSPCRLSDRDAGGRPAG